MCRIVTFLVLCLIVPPHAVGSSVSSEFSAPTLVFKLTVSNPDTVMRHLTQVGVRSLAKGNFGCLTDSSALISLADYPISFSVDRAETLIDADPKIRLAPASSAVFTVSLYPHAAGACGPWSSSVSIVAVFDDGTRLETPSEVINERDVEALRTRNLPRDEVLQGLSHRSVDLRVQSLRQLASAGIDRTTLETKIRLALQDPDRRVRSEAYRQAASLNLPALVPDLIARFALIPLPEKPPELRQTSSAEMLELCRAFTSLRAVGAEPGLLAALTNPNFIYPEALTEVLQNIRTPAMPGALLHAADTHSAWASAAPDSEAGPKLATRYDILLGALIERRDVSSVPLLKSLMARAENKRAAQVILSRVLTLTDATHRVQDPFVLAFRDVARMLANDQWGNARVNLREPAMLLRVRVANEAQEQISLLRAGLRDPSPYVQVAAAREAAALRLPSMAPEILKSYRNAAASFQPYFCSALKTLEAKCGESGASP